MKNIRLLLAFIAALISFSCSREDQIKDESGISRDKAKVTNKEVVKNDTIKKAAEFMVSVAESGLFQVKLAELAVSRAVTLNVKKFAQSNLKHYIRENQVLWHLSKMKGVTLPEIISDIKMNKYRGLEKKSGEDFDKEYLEIVISNLRDNISKTRGAAQHTQDTEVRYWAGEHFGAIEEQLIQAEVLQDSLKGKKRE